MTVLLFLKFAKQARSQSDNAILDPNLNWDYSEYVQSIKKAEAEDVQKAYENWLSEIYLKKARSLVGKTLGQCVEGVRYFLKEETPSEVKGLAKNIPVNSQTPEIGAVIKTKESISGHVGLVIAYSETEVTIFESNVPLGSLLGNIRTLNINDPRIAGYLIGGE